MHVPAPFATASSYLRLVARGIAGKRSGEAPGGARGAERIADANRGGWGVDSLPRYRPQTFGETGSCFVLVVSSSTPSLGALTVVEHAKLSPYVEALILAAKLLCGLLREAIVSLARQHRMNRKELPELFTAFTALRWESKRMR